MNWMAQFIILFLSLLFSIISYGKAFVLSFEQNVKQNLPQQEYFARRPDLPEENLEDQDEPEANWPEKQDIPESEFGWDQDLPEEVSPEFYIPEEEIRRKFLQMGESLRQAGLDVFTEERMEQEAEYRISWLKEIAVFFPELAELYSEPDYLSLLSNEGIGTYDENWNWHPLSQSVYAFSCQSYNSPKMYTEFLRGVESISDGEFSLTHIQENQEEVDFYQSSGSQILTFRYNDHPYYFRSRYMGAWMDCSIIDFMNQGFAKEGNPKRLWCTGDGAQGYIVFYNTEEWAENFEEITGIPLNSSYLLNAKRVARKN